MSNVGIISVGHYVPKQIIDNHFLEKIVDTSDEWITTRTGIKERRVAAKNEKTSDMATKAALEALHNADLKAENIDLIIVGTTTPDSHFPSVACLIQKNIKALNAAAFDVSAACSGYLYAMTTAKQYLLSGMFKKALVIGADKFTNIIDWNDRGTCVLFGDGAGACVLKKVKEPRGILSDYLMSYGRFSEAMQVMVEQREPFDQKNSKVHIPYTIMKGQELFKIAVNSMSEAVHEALKRAHLKVDQVNCVVPHQANDRIITAVARKLKLPKEKFFINIQKYGNMSAASIAVAFYEAVHEKRIKRGDYVAMVAFGAGLVAAANIIKY